MFFYFYRIFYLVYGALRRHFFVVRWPN